jgi:hypothetical protein
MLGGSGLMYCFTQYLYHHYLEICRNSERVAKSLLNLVFRLENVQIFGNGNCFVYINNGSFQFLIYLESDDVSNGSVCVTLNSA